MPIYSFSIYSNSPVFTFLLVKNTSSDSHYSQLMGLSSFTYINPENTLLSPNMFDFTQDFDSFSSTKKRKTNPNTTTTQENKLERSFSFQELMNRLFPEENTQDQPFLEHFGVDQINQVFQVMNNDEISFNQYSGNLKRARPESSEDNFPAGGSGGAGVSQAPRRLWMKNRSKAWWEQYDSLDCPEEEFKKAFRMSKSTFDFICRELEPVVNKKDTMLRSAIPVRQRVAVCIWRLATGEPLREVSKKFGLGISTCHKLVLEVCKAIQDVLKPKVLEWPNERRMNEVKRGFEMFSGIPNVGGSLYTTHIPIIAPKDRVAMYYNKKQTERNQKTSYSVSVQGVVDNQGFFTDVSIGWPGSMPDDKVLEKSSISQRANMGLMNDVVLVGNSGHTLMDWLLVPYTNPNQTWTQHAFNEKVSEIQMIAKEAFMKMKARWFCLQKRTEMKLQDLPVVLMACCVLHNVCEMNNDELSNELRFELLDDEMVAENGVRSANAGQYRDQIAHKLLHFNFAATTSF